MNNRGITKRLALFVIAPVVFGCVAGTLWHVWIAPRHDTQKSELLLPKEQGSIDFTGVSLDVAIQGPGFFPVQLPGSQGQQIAFTRRGSFNVKREGQLVVAIKDGCELVPTITLPTGVTQLQISEDGVITGIRPGESVPTEIGKFQLALFKDSTDLQPLGNCLYQQTAASGPPVMSNPGERGAGQLFQDFLEASNRNTFDTGFSVPDAKEAGQSHG